MTYAYYSSRSIILLLLLCLISVCSADITNPIFYQYQFTTNASNPNSLVTLVSSTSEMVYSQDFQQLKPEDNPKSPPRRIVFNFDYSCPSTNTTLSTIRELNKNGMTTTSIENSGKIALVRRGICNWSEKLKIVSNLASANQINITAIFIYDNDTHSNENISVQSIPTTGSGSLSPLEYDTPLPASRSVLNMTDNDIMNTVLPMPMYFVPFTYGNDLVSKINATNANTDPATREFWVIVPYTSEVGWGYDNSFGSGFLAAFANGKGYLSYIIALAGVFIIGVIFLRWWRLRRMRNDPNNNGNIYTMQQRINRADPLPVDIVNSLPIQTYTDNCVKNTNCAICLEDFVDGKNDIRILPCGHGFCVLCIDPWLTQKSTMCPICKWDCLPPDLRQERDNELANNTANNNNESNINDENNENNNSTGDSHVINMEEASTSTTPVVEHLEDTHQPATVVVPINISNNNHLEPSSSTDSKHGSSTNEKKDPQEDEKNQIQQESEKNDTQNTEKKESPANEKES